jgi:hypothetical protein
MIHDFQTMDIRYVASQRSTSMVAVIPHKLFLQRRKSLLLSFFLTKKTGVCFTCLPILISIAGVHTIGLVGEDLASLLGACLLLCFADTLDWVCHFFALVDSRLHDGVAFLDGFAAYFQGVFRERIFMTLVVFHAVLFDWLSS